MREEWCIANLYMQRYKFLMPKSNRDLPWAVAWPTNHNLRDIAFIGLCTPRLLWNNNVAQGRSQSRVLFMEKKGEIAVGAHDRNRNAGVLATSLQHFRWCSMSAAWANDNESKRGKLDISSCLDFSFNILKFKFLTKRFRVCLKIR